MADLTLTLMLLLFLLLDFLLDFFQIHSKERKKAVGMPLKSCKSLVLQQDMVSPFPDSAASV